MSRVLVWLGIMVAVTAMWLVVADYLHLGAVVTMLWSVVGALLCLLVMIVLPQVAHARVKREYQALIASGNGLIVGKARYRNRRVIHYADGSVAGQAWGRMKSFRTFDDYRAFVDRR